MSVFQPLTCPPPEAVGSSPTLLCSVASGPVAVAPRLTSGFHIVHRAPRHTQGPPAPLRSPAAPARLPTSAPHTACRRPGVRGALPPEGQDGGKARWFLFLCKRKQAQRALETRGQATCDAVPTAGGWKRERPQAAGALPSRGGVTSGGGYLQPGSHLSLTCPPAIQGALRGPGLTSGSA